MALVVWIATFVRSLDHLKLYTDDCFSFELESSMTLYTPYNTLLPTKQVKLLELWDELGVSHDCNKQLWGSTLTIIGFDVDPNAMTVSLPPNKLNDLLTVIHSFCSSASRHHPLRLFMRLAGWMNWALNVFPLLKPVLWGLHAKVGGKEKPEALVYVNATIRFELSWFSHHGKRLGGVHIMESIAWKPCDADFVFFCDASLDSLGCYLPASLTGFLTRQPAWVPHDNIFYLEALCVCWAIHVAHRQSLRGRVLIFTDNENTVAMFNRLYTPFELYNPILLSSVDILIQKTFVIQVVAIPGSENIIADALSRNRIDFLQQHFPNINTPLDEPLPVLASPPRETLGWLPC